MTAETMEDFFRPEVDEMTEVAYPPAAAEVPFLQMMVAFGRLE